MGGSGKDDKNVLGAGKLRGIVGSRGRCSPPQTDSIPGSVPHFPQVIRWSRYDEKKPSWIVLEGGQYRRIMSPSFWRDSTRENISFGGGDKLSLMARRHWYETWLGDGPLSNEKGKMKNITENMERQ